MQCANLSILEEVFPIVTSSVKNADVTKEILAIDLRFDLSIINHNVSQLNRINLLLRKYGIDDVTDSQFLAILNRYKTHLFKENVGVNNHNISKQLDFTRQFNTNTKNSNDCHKQHQNVLHIKDNTLLLSTNNLGDSPMLQQNDNNKPLVQCNINGLNFKALLDACSTGPEGYIVYC